MPRACLQTSKSRPDGTPAWLRSLGRRRKRGSRPCSSRGFISPETQKIGSDPTWVDLALAEHGQSGTGPGSPDPALPGNERTPIMDLLAFAKTIAERVEAEASRAKVPVAVCVIDVHGNVVLHHR